MAKGFKQGAGGGNPLNFRVVGNPQPETAKENTIWIDTDEKITGWDFSATQPIEPTEGMVWIKTSNASHAEFKALKKNNIQVYPHFANQYIGGVWVYMNAKIRKNNEWVDLRQYLYNDGDQCKALTGGWQSLATGGTVTFNESTAYLQTGAVGDFTHICSVNAVDLTALSELVFRVKTEYAYSANRGYPVVGIATSKNSGISSSSLTGYTACAKINTAGSFVEVTLDVSSITGKFYILLSLKRGDKGANSITVSKIWGV